MSAGSPVVLSWAIMKTVEAPENSVMRALSDAAQNRAQNRAKASAADRARSVEDRDTAFKVKGRAIHDTVSLSAGGEKVVNLKRGAELGNEIGNAAIDKNFADKLSQATDDVFRINRLFRQTIRSLFAFWK